MKREKREECKNVNNKIPRSFKKAKVGCSCSQSLHALLCLVLTTKFFKGNEYVIRTKKK